MRSDKDTGGQRKDLTVKKKRCKSARTSWANLGVQKVGSHQKLQSNLGLDRELGDLTS
jgi:hypothetical protein